VQISLDPTQQGYGMPPIPRPGGPFGGKGLDTLAKDLGVSTDDLASARTSGQSLADFATSRGIGRDTLISAVKDSMKANAPDGVQAPSDDQLTALANRLVDRKPGHHGHHHGGAGADAGQMPDQTILDALREASGSDPSSSGGLKSLLSALENLSGSGDGSSSRSEALSRISDLLSGSSTYDADGTSQTSSTTSIGLDATA
jgi:hypothetical protein